MKISKVKLSDLKLAENNVRLHPRRQIEEYVRSLERFGQTKNAVIDEDNNVLIGNGLVMAARELGLSEIYAIKRADLSPNDKLKIMVSDNKIFGLGVDNLDMIDKILEDLKGDLDIPGYDEATLNLMVAGMEDVTAEVITYGVLGGDEVEEIRNRTTRPVQTPITEPSSEPQVEVNDVAVHHKSKEAIGENHSTETANMVKIKCPSCEVDIWLSKKQLHQLMS